MSILAGIALSVVAAANDALPGGTMLALSAAFIAGNLIPQAMHLSMPARTDYRGAKPTERGQTLPHVQPTLRTPVGEHFRPGT